MVPPQTEKAPHFAPDSVWSGHALAHFQACYFERLGSQRWDEWQIGVAWLGTGGSERGEGGEEVFQEAAVTLVEAHLTTNYFLYHQLARTRVRGCKTVRCVSAERIHYWCNSGMSSTQPRWSLTYNFWLLLP